MKRIILAGVAMLLAALTVTGCQTPAGPCPKGDRLPCCDLRACN